MKNRIAFALTTTLIVSACTGSSKNSDDAIQQSTTAGSAVQHYLCDSGETVSAVYTSTDTAIVQYKNKDYSMSIDVSASGSRYVSGDLEWWTKASASGVEGTLLHHQQDGTSGDIIERCTES